MPSPRGPHPPGGSRRHKSLCCSDYGSPGARIVSTYLGIRREERILSVLPFSFDYGLNQLLCAVRCGCTLVLQRSHFPADVCRALERHRITALAGVPPLWIQLMDRASPLPRMELPHLRTITTSGGTFPVDLVRRYRQHLPHVRIYLMYGLSEAFRSTYLPPEELDRRPDSIGKPIPETDVLVLDPEGRPCAPGEPKSEQHKDLWRRLPPGGCGPRGDGIVFA